MINGLLEIVRDANDQLWQEIPGSRGRGFARMTAEGVPVLLAAVNRGSLPGPVANLTLDRAYETLLAAVADNPVALAVLELHKPVDPYAYTLRRVGNDAGWRECGGCDPGYRAEELPDWPCSTVGVIDFCTVKVFEA